MRVYFATFVHLHKCVCMYLCICIDVCIYILLPSHTTQVCMYVRMYAYLCMYVCLWYIFKVGMHTCKVTAYANSSDSESLSLSNKLHLCLRAVIWLSCTYACMHVCMCMYMYMSLYPFPINCIFAWELLFDFPVHMHACMYVCVCICIWVSISFQ